MITVILDTFPIHRSNFITNSVLQFMLNIEQYLLQSLTGNGKYLNIT